MKMYVVYNTAHYIQLQQSNPMVYLIKGQPRKNKQKKKKKKCTAGQLLQFHDSRCGGINAFILKCVFHFILK